jgi:hypothetical protein
MSCLSYLSHHVVQRVRSVCDLAKYYHFYYHDHVKRHGNSLPLPETARLAYIIRLQIISYEPSYTPARYRPITDYQNAYGPHLNVRFSRLLLTFTLYSSLAFFIFSYTSHHINNTTMAPHKPNTKSHTSTTDQLRHLLGGSREAPVQESEVSRQLATWRRAQDRQVPQDVSKAWKWLRICTNIETARDGISESCRCCIYRLYATLLYAIELRHALILSQETHNQIFGYVLRGKTFEIIHSAYSKDWDATKPKHAHALLALCRQVYAETALLPFNSNTFSTHAISTLNEWCKRLPTCCTRVVPSAMLHIEIAHLGPDVWQCGFGSDTFGSALGSRSSLTIRLPSLQSLHVAIYL